MLLVLAVQCLAVGLNRIFFYSDTSAYVFSYRKPGFMHAAKQTWYAGGSRLPQHNIC